MVNGIQAQSQCKGFEYTVDPFKGEEKMHTLWITNSLKIKGNKMFYRLEKQGDTTLFLMKTSVDRRVILSDSAKVYLIGDGSDQVIFQSVGEQATELVKTVYGEHHQLEAKFYVSDSDLIFWHSGLNRLRLYYNDDTMTFELNQKKNQRLFHAALDCYEEAYFKAKAR